ARVLDDSKPKYLNTPETLLFHKGRNLYGIGALKNMRVDARAILVEGYMDVITAHQYGVCNAVATLGTAFTVEHGRLLKRYAPEYPRKLTVYLAFDGDKAGTKAAQSGLIKLRGLTFIDVRILVLPPGDDPDDFLRRQGNDGWQELLHHQALPILDFLLRLALSRHDTDNAAGKSDVVAELLPAIAETASGVERDSFIRTLAQRLQVGVDSIYADLRRSGLKTAQPLAASVNPQAMKIPVIKRSGGFLLRLAITDKNIFQLAKRELGENFPANEQEALLISLIESLGDEYDYNPATLFNHLPSDSEGLRRFLLKLLDADIPDGDKGKLAAEWINGVKRSLLQQQIAALRQRLTLVLEQGGDTRELLLEKIVLDKQLQDLKG
ncbi:MAG: toprim domain-containing protein, partial [Clostridiales bacterium]